MSEPPFQMPHLPSGAGYLAVLTFFGTVVASVLAWFGVRFSQRAPLQEAVNHSVEILMKGWEKEDLRSTALISALRKEIAAAAQKLDLAEDHIGDLTRHLLEEKAITLELSGEVANLKQAAVSRLRLETRADTSPIPPTSKLRKHSDEGDT